MQNPITGYQNKKLHFLSFLEEKIPTIKYPKLKTKKFQELQALQKKKIENKEK